jgi:hypothetical protein
MADFVSCLCKLVSPDTDNSPYFSGVIVTVLVVLLTLLTEEIKLHVDYICTGRDSNSPRAGRSGDQIPVGAGFSAPVQTAPRTNPTSYTMGNGSFPALKRPKRGVGLPLLTYAEVKERVELYIYSPTGPAWPGVG